MSLAVVEAERTLAQCVRAMHETLQAAAEDALPSSQRLEDRGQIVADTLMQRLEEERRVEALRLLELSRDVPHALDRLRAAVVQLGGGLDGQQRVLDLPEEALDQEIAALAAESGRLATLAVAQYDEAARLAAVLEEELMGAEVPPM